MALGDKAELASPLFSKKLSDGPLSICHSSTSIRRFRYHALSSTAVRILYALDATVVLDVADLASLAFIICASSVIVVLISSSSSSFPFG